jgi:hypothetical protein
LLIASLTWATSSSAATRGATFLPRAVDGKTNVPAHNPRASDSFAEKQ